jgi:RNA polymerase sigma-70 factor
MEYTPVSPSSELPDDDSMRVGSREVFEILAAQNADMLVSYLRSLVRSPDALEDLFQETMLTAWRKLPDFDRTRAFGPWLRGIAANKVRQHRDRSRRDLAHCDDTVMKAIEQRFATVPPDGGLHRMVEALLECVQKLPDKLRHAVEFVYRRGLGIRAAADTLDASEEAIKKRVQRGRKLLAECVQAEESLS